MPSIAKRLSARYLRGVAEGYRFSKTIRS